MSKFKSLEFSNLKEYVPGEQPQDKQYIKLNTNESPYPPSPDTVKAVSGEEVENLRLYSDPECKKLKSAIAECYNMKAENIFVSNGSDEILNFAFMLYGKASGAVFADITYGFYKVFAELYGIDYEVMPLNDDFTINVDDYKSTGKFTVIANPNAPTGIALSLSEIEEIVASNPDTIVLVDEAYVDFGAKSARGLVNKYKNLIVCMTYSKSRSMAGARLGFCFADEELIKDLELIKYSTNPYNINRLTQVAGTAAIKNNGYYMQNCERIIETRNFTTKELTDLGFAVLESKANFVFAKHEGISGLEFYKELKANGVLVRHFETDKITDFNRITIGSLEEMTEFINITRKILKEKGLLK